MMKREWKALLGRYGRRVTLMVPGQEPLQVKAFLQPILDKEPQLQPSPLGLRMEERMLYLGPGEVLLSPGTLLAIQEGQRWAVRSARSVGDGHHVWAVLQRMEDEE